MNNIQGENTQFASHSSSKDCSIFISYSGAMNELVNPSKRKYMIWIHVMKNKGDSI